MLAPSNIACTAEWRDVAALADVVAEWRALADRAAEPNVFFEPSFALAAWPVFAPGAGAILVWSNDLPRRLIGLVPFAARTRLGLPMLVGLTHRYGPLGTPLFDRIELLAAVTAFLDHVAATAALPKLMLLPYFCESGPVAAAFDAALAQRGGRQSKFGEHQRALLAPTRRDDDVKTALGAKRRKNLKAQRRRLAETGGLHFDYASAPEEIHRALADFLAIEAKGWKGADGGAATSHADIRAFVETAVTALADEGKADVGRLMHGGRAIAAAILLRSGRGRWFWKIAYDEAFARESPGVQITLDLTDTMLRDAATAWCDSCATADHAMIDRLWRQRRPLADRLIGLGGGARFALACWMESLWRAAMGAATRWRDRLRG
jgi:CelD/BcsL family acetyltransferase involved in cellulose biosynthesis